MMPGTQAKGKEVIKGKPTGRNQRKLKRNKRKAHRIEIGSGQVSGSPGRLPAAEIARGAKAAVEDGGDLVEKKQHIYRALVSIADVPHVVGVVGGVGVGGWWWWFRGGVGGGGGGRRWWWRFVWPAGRGCAKLRSARYKQSYKSSRSTHGGSDKVAKGKPVSQI